MNFSIMQFEMYCETLTKLSNTTNSVKRKELIDRLEMIRKGMLPVSFKGER